MKHLMYRVMSWHNTNVATWQERRDQGATAVEYGLMVFLIAVAIIVAVGTLGTNLKGMFQAIAVKIGTVTIS